VFTGPVSAPSFLGNGANLSGVAPASGSPNYVAKGGDTMGGKLSITSAQDALEVTGFQPYITLRDSNAGNALTRMQSAQGNLQLQAGGTDRMTLTSAVNVGIGTTTPAVQLHVAGGSGEVAQYIGSGDDALGRMKLRYDATGRSSLITSWATDGYRPSQLEGSQIVLNSDSSGNVGVGTTSPSDELHIMGNLSQFQNGGLTVENADTGGANITLTNTEGGAAITANNGMLFVQQPLGRAAISIDPSSNVGIGTSSPQAKLDVNGTVRATSFQGSGAGSSDISPGAIASGTVTSSLQFTAPPLFSSSFSVGSPTKVNNLNADLLDGLDSTSFAPAAGSGNYVWKSGDTMSGTLNLPSNGLVAGGTQLILTGGNVAIGTGSAGSYRLYVNGSAYSTGGWVGSDARFEKDVQPLTNTLAKVLQLTGTTYQWRREESPDRSFEDGRQLGFIAQEVEKVLPEAVRTDSQGYRAIAYDKLTAILVEGIKEQQRALEARDAQIAKLSQRLDAIERLVQASAAK
jgi:hypothetical protein